MPETIGVGIAGCGGMGRMHLNACGAIDGVEVKALWDVLPEKAEKLAEGTTVAVESSLETLLARDDVAAVIVATPTPTHHEITMKAVALGKHVFCEKPIARTVEQGREMVQAVAEKSVIGIVGQVVRYTPAYELMRDAINDSRWGKLLHLRLNRVASGPNWEGSGWFLDAAKSGGAILDMHLHDTDFLLYAMGAPNSVRTTGLHSEHSGWYHSTTYYAYDNVTVEANSGWYAVEEYPFNASYFALFEEGILELDGTREGKVLFHPREGKPFTPEMNPLPEGEVEGINVTGLGAYMLEVEAFFKAIWENDKDTRASMEKALKSMQLVMLEIESAEKNEAVEVHL